SEVGDNSCDTVFITNAIIIVHIYCIHYFCSNKIYFIYFIYRCGYAPIQIFEKFEYNQKIRLPSNDTMKTLRYVGKKYREILFSDEKIFTVGESCNKQNDKVYAHSSEEASNRIPRVQRGHFPSSLMVWLRVSYWGLTEIHFCEKGVKTDAVVYQNTVLTNLVEPVSHTMFNNRHWVFRQDSAAAHRAKSTQD
ncbi:unnamed protein product, partial [Chilo suppressalis]